jgi:hypothetical protein
VCTDREDIRANFGLARLAACNVRTVWPLLEQLAGSGLGGGMTYDVVILRSATDAGATSLLTLNARGCERLEPPLRIEVP